MPTDRIRRRSTGFHTVEAGSAPALGWPARIDRTNTARQRDRQEFQTIRSEGALLPSDLLRRLIALRSKLPGVRPKDYAPAARKRLNEAVAHSWTRLRRRRTEFRAAATANLSAGEASTGLTNNKWSLPRLREPGFGILPATAGPETGGRTCAIRRFFGPAPVHLHQGRRRSGGVTVRFRSKTYVPPRRVERGVTERQRAILALLADAPDGLPLREIVPSLASSATVRQVRDDLKALRVLGLAIGEGRGRGARWKRR